MRRVDKHGLSEATVALGPRVGPCHTVTPKIFGSPLRVVGGLKDWLEGAAIVGGEASADRHRHALLRSGHGERPAGESGANPLGEGIERVRSFAGSVARSTRPSASINFGV